MPRLQRTIVETMTQSRGFKMTPQRRAIVDYLQSAHHHPTADEILQAVNRKFPMTSRATVYNTLNAFIDAGLVRQVAVDGARVYFDTNVDAHHHFFDEDTGQLEDIPASRVAVASLPEPPLGADITRVDVIVRVKRRS